ncbi:MAG TPA: hypothetical protein VGS57_19440 [Thermoanaerobaculia bacterium]|jgi:hypothetical protein|nr:hypothetical protein [Thermoanaerobaculia bacterium]
MRAARLALGSPLWILSAALLTATASAATAPSAQSAAAPAIRARLSPSQITVGDRVRVELEVTLLSGERWGPPALDPRLRQWGEAEILAAQRPQALPGAPARYRLDLLVTAFKPGTVTLPPIAVFAAPLHQEDPSPPPPLRLDTPPLQFTVRSVLPAEGEPTPQPPTPPQPVPLGHVFWWTSGGLALACLAAVGLLLWRRRGIVAAVPATAPLTPLARFRRDLAALAAEPSLEQLHTGISMALRQLLAALLAFPAAERTTTEIDRELRRSRLEANTRRRLLELLRRCDEVKFAKRATSRQEANERLAAARDLGNDVTRELVPEPAAPAAETAA